MIARIEDLLPEFRPFVLAMQTELDREGVRARFYEGLRTAEDQHAAFLRGASKCDGYRLKSLHQSGLAADWVALDENGHWSWDYAKFQDVYKAIGRVARQCGLVTGQDWYPSPYEKLGFGWDPPHTEMKGAQT